MAAFPQQNAPMDDARIDARARHHGTKATHVDLARRRRQLLLFSLASVITIAFAASKYEPLPTSELFTEPFAPPPQPLSPSPPQPIESLSSLIALAPLSSSMSSTYSPAFAATRCLDGNASTICATRREHDAWISVEVNLSDLSGALVVGVLNRAPDDVDAATGREPGFFQSWLFPFEVWVASVAGVASRAQGASRCGRIDSTHRLATGVGPFMVQCPVLPTGGKVFATIKQVGAYRSLTPAEVLVFQTAVGNATPTNAHFVTAPSPPPPAKHVHGHVQPNAPPPLLPPEPRQGLAAGIVARFHRPPFGGWPADGTLPDKGVLIHCFDNFHHGAEEWVPKPGGDPFRRDGIEHGVSASLIFSAQNVLTSGQQRIPTYTCDDGGVIFAPWTARIACGNAADVGALCTRWCAHPNQLDPSAKYPGDGCNDITPLSHGGSWRPADSGEFLRRVTRYQSEAQKLYYNEFLVEGRWWTSHLPGVIEAIFTTHVTSRSQARTSKPPTAKDRFVRGYGLEASAHPLLIFDPWNWSVPFREAAGSGIDSDRIE